MVLKCKLNCLFITRLSIPGCCYKKISAYRTVLSTFLENVSLSKIVGLTFPLKRNSSKSYLPEVVQSSHYFRCEF